MTPSRTTVWWWYLAPAGALAAVPYFSSGGYHTYLATLVLIYAIAAIGLNILMGYAGQTSLAQAAFMAVGAYTATLVSRYAAPLGSTGWSAALGVAAGTLGAAVAGTLLSFPALRVRGPYLAMMTVAFGWMVWRILIEWVPVTGGELGILNIPKPRVGGRALAGSTYYYLVLAAFGAVFEFQRRLVASRFGTVLAGIRHEEVVVASTGIPVARVKVVAFAISSGIAGFAGGLFSFHQSYLNPDSFQIFDSVMILLAVLLGGAGTLAGPLVGAAILVVLPELLQGFGEYRLIVYGVLTLTSLFLLPKGLVGAAADPPPAPAAAPAARGSTGEFPPVEGGTLAVAGVSLAFGGVVALRDVELRVERGTVHAVIGSNGAGKTTLINVLTAVHRADAGRVELDGRVVRFGSLSAAARGGVVRTFQHVRTLGDMTVLEHVLISLAGREGLGLVGGMFFPRRAAQARERHKADAYRLLALFGLDHLAGAAAHKLSHGHRRLLELTRALAARPRVLLLDEPAAGLVAGEVRELGAALHRLRAAGLTILLVEHNIDLVTAVADRVTVLDRGAVIAAGAPHDVLRDERVIESYLGAVHAPRG